LIQTNQDSMTPPWVKTKHSIEEKISTLPSMKFTQTLWRKNSSNLKNSKWSTRWNQTLSISWKSLSNSGSRLSRKNSELNYRRLTTGFLGKPSKIMKHSCTPNSLISKEWQFSSSKWVSCKLNKAMSKRIKLMTYTS
jgi:hypothetical protein